jgi:nucleotide-binding universal stress UspA family protein
MIHRVLIAINDSAGAFAAAEVASDLGDQLDAKVALVHVIDPSLAMTPETGVNIRLLQPLRESAAALLQRARQRMPTKQAVEQIIVESLPAQGILETAHDWKADLLFIGADARGRVASLLLGSVADDLLRHSPCPVITVREKIVHPVMQYPVAKAAANA